MGIRFRFSRNKKIDTLRFFIAGLFFFLLITFFWNRSKTPLSSLDAGYQGFFLEGKWKNRMLTPEGVEFLKEYIETNTRATRNPLTILRHHSAIARGASLYEFVIGLQSVESSETVREYGIYQRGDVVFLQVEPVGIDRVLTASFTADVLENELTPYIGGEFTSQAISNP